MEQLLHRLHEQDRERDDEPDVERRKQSPAREEELFEEPFDHG
jgi:hypothetical protein